MPSLSTLLAHGRLRNSGEPCGGNVVATDFADAVQPSRYSIQCDIDILKLTSGCLTDSLQRLIVLQLDGSVVGIATERLQLSRQVLADPTPSLLQLSSPSEQAGSHLIERPEICGHGTPVLTVASSEVRPANSPGIPVP